MTLRAREPFRFFSRLSLTLATGLRARNLKELLHGVSTVPEPVIYHHTHHFLQQHQYLVPEPPNDFAYWVRHMLQDERLGERLAAIDTVRFNSIDALRRALISAIEEGLAEADLPRFAPEGKEFHFMSARRFSMPTSRLAHDLAEFAEGLKGVSISSLYLHVFEARLRPPLGINDFSLWFDTQLGESELARKVAGLDPYTQTMEGLRARILSLIEERLSHAS